MNSQPVKAQDFAKQTPCSGTGDFKNLNEKDTIYHNIYINKEATIS